MLISTSVIEKDVIGKLSEARRTTGLSLSPSEAACAWLDGDFGVGDEPALIAAILKDTKIKLSTEKIAEYMSDVMNDKDADVQAILDRLAEI